MAGACSLQQQPGTLYELESLQQVLVEADSVIFGDLLRQCAEDKALLEGKLIHAQILKSRFSRQTYLKNLLVQMYAKCGCLAEACSVFNDIHPKNKYSFNIMIAAYAQNGHTTEALMLFEKVVGELEGDACKIAFVNVLGAFVSEDDLENGRVIHAKIAAADGGCAGDVIVGTALLSMYGRCGGIEEARMVFDRIRNDSTKVVPWNAMLAAYAQSGNFGLCLKLFRDMDLEGIRSNDVTYATVVDACGDLGDLREARRIYQRIRSIGLDSNDTPTGNSLINMFGKCRSPREAREVFDAMIGRNVITWTALISAFVDGTEAGEENDVDSSAAALKVLREMDLDGLVRPNETTFTRIVVACSCCGGRGAVRFSEVRQIHRRIVSAGMFKSNLFLATSIVNMYSKWGKLEEAVAAFEAIEGKDSIVWNSIIAAMESGGRAEEAIGFFRRMDAEGVEATEGTFASVLSAIGDRGQQQGARRIRIDHGREIHERILSSGIDFRSGVLGNALVHMYGRCGWPDRAQEVFDSMRRRNISCWTSLIEAYAQQGRGDEALMWFQRMHLEGIQPDKITFVGILFACSHSGLLAPAVYYFVSMQEDHGIAAIEEHYQCLVDLLARLGQLERAEELIESMPFHPRLIAWRTLLAGSSLQASECHGGGAAQHVLDLEPRDSSSLVTLCSIISKPSQ